jgi:hypothetical protein
MIKKVCPDAEIQRKQTNSRRETDSSPRFKTRLLCFQGVDRNPIQKIIDHSVHPLVIVPCSKTTFNYGRIHLEYNYIENKIQSLALKR